MKPQRPNKSWFEEHTGLKIDLRWIARKTWKAYFSMVTGIAVFFTPTPTLTQARPPEVDPHVPSESQPKTATLEASNLFNVASTANSSVRYVDLSHMAGSGFYRIGTGTVEIDEKKAQPTPPTS